MASTHGFTNSDGNIGKFQISAHPDKCPICGLSGQPDFVIALGATELANSPIFVAYRCPITKCRGLYVGFYHSLVNNAVRYGTLKVSNTFKVTEVFQFPPNIQSTSKNFCEIYEQAKIAEDNGLNQVIGPAYRKSLEFLIKDFVIMQKYSGDTKQQEVVRGTFLGKVIDDHIDEAVIKQCAKRAAWLGNDETHYIRKWENKDINDLKALIKITVSFIDMSIEAARYLKEMPDGNGAKTPSSDTPSPAETELPPVSL